jgi:hypothetical protein
MKQIDFCSMDHFESTVIAATVVVDELDVVVIVDTQMSSFVAALD